jgi:hypothetical protein
MELPSNNEMQRTSHGQDRGSPLISVFDGPNASVAAKMRGGRALWLSCSSC